MVCTQSIAHRFQNDPAELSTVITLTTKHAAPLVEAELETRSRQSGLFSVQSESGTVEVQATSDEIEDFEREGNPPIESDVIPDGLMRRLVDYLREEKLLEGE